MSRIGQRMNETVNRQVTQTLLIGVIALLVSSEEMSIVKRVMRQFEGKKQKRGSL